MKLTPWYPPRIKPVRVGWYDVDASFCEDMRCHWNGEWWSVGSRRHERPQPLRKSVHQNRTWRGVEK